MSQFTKDQLENMFKEFLPKYKAGFANAPADDASWLEKFGYKLYNSDSMARTAFEDYLNRQDLADADALQNTIDYFTNASKTPFSTKKTHLGSIDILDDVGRPLRKTSYTNNPFKKSVGGAWNYAKSNSGTVLGTAATTAGSLAGLFDNDKIGGQLIGTVAGAALPALAGAKLSPLMAYNVAAGAGSLGALFDKLREKKADERAAMANSPYGKEEYVR